MLDPLFGNRAAAKILLFLERYGQAHAWGLAGQLHIPLNMVQKQLERFHRAGVLTKRFQGRRKIYSWDPDYPFITELKSLLRKGQERLPDPADGSHLSLEDRVFQSEALIREAEAVHSRRRPDPFARSFDSFEAYERWRKKQNNPWLV